VFTGDATDVEVGVAQMHLEIFDHPHSQGCVEWFAGPGLVAGCGGEQRAQQIESGAVPVLVCWRINAPVDQVDLQVWLFTVYGSEYQATAKGAPAVEVITTGGVRGMVNVESIGGALVVRHYQAVQVAGTRIEMLAKRSRAYLFHLIPVTVLSAGR
jgi:hypothetical protein